MDKKLKRTVIIIFIVSFIGQMASLIYLTKMFTEINLQLIIGSSLLILGISILYIIFVMKKTEFKGKELLFYGMFLNPGLVSIFSGITAIAGQYQLRHIELIAVIIVVLCLLAGFVIYVVAAIKRFKDT